MNTPVFFLKGIIEQERRKGPAILGEVEGTPHSCFAPLSDGLLPVSLRVVGFTRTHVCRRSRVAVIADGNYHLRSPRNESTVSLLDTLPTSICLAGVQTIPTNSQAPTSAIGLRPCETVPYWTKDVATQFCKEKPYGLEGK